MDSQADGGDVWKDAHEVGFSLLVLYGVCNVQSCTGEGFLGPLPFHLPSYKFLCSPLFTSVINSKWSWHLHVVS